MSDSVISLASLVILVATSCPATVNDLIDAGATIDQIRHAGD